MKNTTEHYKSSQKAYWIFPLFFIIGIFLYLKYDNKAFIYPVILLILTGLIFHKLTIAVNDEQIAAYFAFGLFKRKMKLSEVDESSIERIKLKWWTGIGIRFTTHGLLYNVKVSEAIKIISKNKSKTFFVGTDDYDAIKQVVLNQIS